MNKTILEFKTLATKVGLPPARAYIRPGLESGPRNFTILMRDSVVEGRVTPQSHILPDIHSPQELYGKCYHGGGKRVNRVDCLPAQLIDC